MSPIDRLGGLMHVEQPAIASHPHGVPAIAHSQLAVDRFQMLFDGVLRDTQCSGDLSIGGHRRQIQEHGLLAFGQRLYLTQAHRDWLHGDPDQHLLHELPIRPGNGEMAAKHHLYAPIRPAEDVLQMLLGGQLDGPGHRLGGQSVMAQPVFGHRHQKPCTSTL